MKKFDGIIFTLREVKFRITIIILLAFGVVSFPGYAAEVLFVDITGSPSVVEQQLELACRYYGLDIEHLSVGENGNNHQVIETLKRSSARAIVITGNALPDIDKQEFLSNLKKELQRTVPLLIADVTSACDKNALRSWSGGAVIGCINSTKALINGFYMVADLKDIVRQLAGQDIPFNSKREYHLILEKDKKSQEIIWVADNNKESLFPVFVRTIIDGQEVFFQVETSPSDSAQKAIWEYDSKRFFEIAPLMMFLRYSCGERCWHSTGHYANLTIDDPWLTEPYGHLSYKGLLKEMQKVNFHTTIAFIPWNYDRSDPEVVSLFREYPQRFSICIHGNNHDHREFYKYETKLGDPWPAKPLSEQKQDIVQALSRMEAFYRLTGLAYDKIMVFPHGIGPAKTLNLLKKYNFLATINSGNVPLESQEPNDPLFSLRSVTMQFESFPSINRFSPKNTSRFEIAKELFLDNPILFYSHHDLFEKGIDGFNKTAETINSIQPDIEWTSLGNILRHFYIKRLREDGDYDILTFSSNIILKNKHSHDAKFFVQKEDSFSLPIKEVTINGHVHSYNKAEGKLVFTANIPKSELRHIFITYENDLHLPSIDTSKANLRVQLLRRLSDLRDLTLSTNKITQGIVLFYYEHGLFRLGLLRLTVLSFFFLTLVGFVGWRFRKRLRRDKLNSK